MTSSTQARPRRQCASSCRKRTSRVSTPSPPAGRSSTPSSRSSSRRSGSIFLGTSSTSSPPRSRMAAASSPARRGKMRLQLVIGNKNYSSWSMRPWVLARQAQIPFEEVQLQFDENSGGVRVAGIEPYSPTHKVPVLHVDGEPVWDSLAICETLAELHPEKGLWPADS